jgi:hypothetical protein
MAFQSPGFAVPSPQRGPLDNKSEYEAKDIPEEDRDFRIPFFPDKGACVAIRFDFRG